MSKEMEKLFRDLHKFLDARGGKNLSEAEMEQLVSQFMEDYNASVRTGEPSTPEEPETAYDYLELAAEAKTKKQRVEYTNKALELEPDNLDACLAKIALTAKHPHEMLDELEKLLKKGDAQMEKVPYMLVVGDRDVQNNTVAPRHRADGDLGTMNITEFTELLRKKVNSKTLK